MAAGVYRGRRVTVVMDPPPVVYTKVFHPNSGPERYLRKKAEQVAFRAKELAPKRTGRLALSIRVDQNRDEKGRYAFGFKVFTPVYYGLYVHEGTRPHSYISYPGQMKFDGTNEYSGQLIFTSIVNHPGNAAQPFLQQALSAMED